MDSWLFNIAQALNGECKFVVTNPYELKNLPEFTHRFMIAHLKLSDQEGSNLAQWFHSYSVVKWNEEGFFENTMTSAVKNRGASAGRVTKSNAQDWTRMSTTHPKSVWYFYNQDHKTMKPHSYWSSIRYIHNLNPTKHGRLNAGLAKIKFYWV